MQKVHVPYAAAALALTGRGNHSPEYSAQRRGGNPKQEQPMKLNSTQVEQTLRKLNAEVLADDHPAVTQLTKMFGDHTFFLDGSGLKILEPGEVPEMELQSGEVVSLADWSDATLTRLRPRTASLRRSSGHCGVWFSQALP